MYRIINNRGSGKSSHLMLLAKEHNAVFVCSNPRAMEAKARAYGIIGIDFIDYHTYLNSKEIDWGKVVIDELEMFINYMQTVYCGKNELIGYTLSNED